MKRELLRKTSNSKVDLEDVNFFVNITTFLVNLCFYSRQWPQTGLRPRLGICLHEDLIKREFLFSNLLLMNKQKTPTKKPPLLIWLP